MPSLPTDPRSPDPAPRHPGRPDHDAADHQADDHDVPDHQGEDFGVLAVAAPDPDGPEASDAAPSAVTVDVLAAWLGLEVPEEVPPVPAISSYAQPDAPAPPRVVLLDVRYRATQGGTDHEAYVRGHLPGAVYAALPTRLAGQGPAAEGRHPLPDPLAFAQTLRMWGIDEGDTVVVYDDDAGRSAARAWWLLRHAGVTESLLLDGGLAAWRAAGLPLQAGEVIPTPGGVHGSWGQMPVVDAAGAVALAHEGLLLDARAGERYRGEEEPLDPVAGHIPGAVSLPTSGNIGPDGRLLPPAELAARFAEVGIRPGTPVGVYCGSGVTAAHEVFALTMAQLPGAALYPGSWSAWVQDPQNPVAVGPSPDGD